MKKMIITFFILLFIGLNVNCFAVTEFVCTCNKTGEDFNTVTLWENAMDNATDLTDGTVKTGNWDGQTGPNIADNAAVTWDGGGSNGTLIHMTGTQYLIDVLGGTLEDNDTISDGGESSFDIAGSPDSAILTLEIYDDDGILTDNADINGLITSASNYMKITVPAGERHDGTEFSGVIWQSGDNDENLEIEDQYFRVEWIQFTNSQTWGKGAVYFVGGPSSDYGEVSNCIIRDVRVNYGAIRVYYGKNVKIYNNIIYNITRDNAGTNGDGIYVVNSSGEQCLIYNNTIYNVDRHCISEDGDEGPDCRNNACFDPNQAAVGGMCFSGSFNGSSDYNCISGTNTAGGGNTLISKSASDNFTNITGGSENFHLKSGADCVNVGSDLGTEANIDIDGRNRDSEGDVWDIGADEYVGAGGGAPYNPSHLYIFSSVRSCVGYGGGGGLDNVIASNGDNIIAANGDNLVAN